MIPQLVAERCPQFPVQVQDAALVRVQQQDLQGGFLAQRPVASLKLENRAEAKEQAVNNQMLWQMFELVRRMGKDEGGSNMTELLLASENRELKQQIIQRTVALEEEWLGAAEHVSVKVDAIYLKLNQLHKEITTEDQEARRVLDLELKCVLGSEWDYAALRRVFGEDYSTRGAADAVNYICSSYLSYMPAYRNDWEKLHLTIRDSLRAFVKAEVQKIKDEMLPEELILEEARDLQQIDAADVNEADPIDVYGVFHAFTQMSQEEIQTRDARNDAIRGKNQGLRNKKIELENMNKRFLNLFYQSLRYPLKFLRDKIKVEIQTVKNHIKDYPKLLAELGSQPTSRRSGCYKKGIELHDKISSVLSEIIVLAEALDKELTV